MAHNGDRVPRRSGTPWTYELHEQLIDLYISGSHKRIASIVGRSNIACRVAIFRLSKVNSEQGRRAARAMELQKLRRAGQWPASTATGNAWASNANTQLASSSASTSNTAAEPMNDHVPAVNGDAPVLVEGAASDDEHDQENANEAEAAAHQPMDGIEYPDQAQRSPDGTSSDDESLVNSGLASVDGISPDGVSPDGQDHDVLMTGMQRAVDATPDILFIDDAGRSWNAEEREAAATLLLISERGVLKRARDSGHGVSTEMLHAGVSVGDHDDLKLDVVGSEG